MLRICVLTGLVKFVPAVYANVLHGAVKIRIVIISVNAKAVWIANAKMMIRNALKAKAVAMANAVMGLAAIAGLANIASAKAVNHACIKLAPMKN